MPVSPLVSLPGLFGGLLALLSALAGARAVFTGVSGAVDGLMLWSSPLLCSSCGLTLPINNWEGNQMAFNNSELNRIRKGWDRENEISDPTDPDYAEKAEQRFLRDLLTLTEDEQIMALSGYTPKRQKELVAKLFRLKKQSDKC